MGRTRGVTQVKSGCMCVPACVGVCECLLCPASFTRGAIMQSDNRNLDLPTTPHTPLPRSRRGPLRSACVCARTCVMCIEPLEICIVGREDTPRASRM